jgi:hypothetical protein
MKRMVHMINEAGVHMNGRFTRLAGAVVKSDRFLKIGADAAHVIHATAADKPIGIGQNDCDAAEEVVTVASLSNAPGTKLVRMSGACAAGDELCPAADGKAQTIPAAPAGTYYAAARALTAGVDDQLVEVESFYPKAVTVN